MISILALRKAFGRNVFPDGRSLHLLCHMKASNLANPTALLLSAVMMLRHLELNDKADQIHNAILNTIAEGKHRTVDLRGKATTTEFTKAVCHNL
ncbi:Isocitrate dehydrogenase [NAD] catalytic subunit 5, mitochondrial [Asimina triloba]